VTEPTETTPPCSNAATSDCDGLSDNYRMLVDSDNLNTMATISPATQDGVPQAGSPINTSCDLESAGAQPSMAQYVFPPLDPSPEPVPPARSSEVHSFFAPQKRKLAISNSLPDPKAIPNVPVTKKAKLSSLPSKKPLAASKSDGTGKAKSRSAVAKAAQKAAITSGTFVRSDVKWERFKAKIRQMDPNAQFNETDSQHIRDVWHSRCAAIIVMLAPYDINYFNKHLKKCKPTKPSANTLPLDIMLSSSGAKLFLNRSNNPKTVKWPCPGISAIDNARIKRYLKRVQAPSGGGQSEQTIALDMFSKEYSKLSITQKVAVDMKQTQTHRWRNDHQHGHVFARGTEAPCLETVEVAMNPVGEPLKVQACTACKALLSFKKFITAIEKELPDAANSIYVPRRHQGVLIGKAYAKNCGLRNLLYESGDSDGVCFVFIPILLNSGSLTKFQLRMTQTTILRLQRISFFVLLALLSRAPLTKNRCSWV